MGSKPGIQEVLVGPGSNFAKPVQLERSLKIMPPATQGRIQVCVSL
jgi:hypothetical protein